MRLGNNEWVEDIQQIIRKNSVREFIFFIALVVTYIFFAFLVLNGYYIIGISVFIIGIIVIFLLPKSIRIAFADLIAFNLFRLSINIERYNGRNPHYKEEAKKALVDLDIDIEDYIRKKKKSKLIDFEDPKIREYIIRLHDNTKKILPFFEEYNTYKNEQDKISNIVKRLAFSFRQYENFPNEAYNLIDELDRIQIPKKPIRIELKPLVKKYILDNMLVRGLLFITIFTFAVWYLPNYTPWTLSTENKLIIIIPVLALAIIQMIFPSPASSKKS
ncbi:hypothetical protein HYY70_01355 [Candidatus Woesearchaeota archaeon]|nr:hypothetical protein [Candidatus Woesearchaeota archaeon]